MMPDDAFTPQELNLIKRLQNAPKPELSSQRFAEIRQQVLEQVDAPPNGTSSQSRPWAGGDWLIWVVVALVAATLIAALVWLNRPLPPEEAEPQPAVVPTAAVTPSLAVKTPTSVVTPTLATTQTPTPTLDIPRVVIEGPIEAIDGNVITIFDVEIQVDQAEPLLSVLEIGDIVHVEGQAAAGNPIILVSITLTLVENSTLINPQESNPAVPPGCRVTGKGTIKCSKKKSNKDD